MGNTLGEIIDSLRKNPKVEMWEYRTIDGVPSTNILNQMGIEGWGMCGVCSLPQMKPMYYFKRKIQ